MTDEQIRLECLRLAWSMANDGKEPDLDEVRRIARELLAFVHDREAKKQQAMASDPFVPFVKQRVNPDTGGRFF